MMKPGDRVRIIRGDYEGRTGTVVDAADHVASQIEAVRGLLRPSPVRERIEGNLQIPPGCIAVMLDQNGGPVRAVSVEAGDVVPLRPVWPPIDESQKIDDLRFLYARLRSEDSDRAAVEAIQKIKGDFVDIKNDPDVRDAAYVANRTVSIEDRDLVPDAPVAGARDEIRHGVRAVVAEAVAQAFDAYDHGYNANRAEMVDHAASRAANQLVPPIGIVQVDIGHIRRLIGSPPSLASENTKTWLDESQVFDDRKFAVCRDFVEVKFAASTRRLPLLAYLLELEATAKGAPGGRWRNPNPDGVRRYGEVVSDEAPFDEGYGGQLVAESMSGRAMTFLITMQPSATLALIAKLREADELLRDCADAMNFFLSDEAELAALSVEEVGQWKAKCMAIPDRLIALKTIEVP